MLRFLTLFFLLAVLSGCTAVFSDVRETWRYATAERPDANISPAEIHEFPYTALYMERPDEARAFVVLGYIDGHGENQELSWVTRQKETLVTRHGRLVRTVDVDKNLIATSGLADDPLRCIQRALLQEELDFDNCDLQWQRQIDIDSGDAQHSVAVTSRFEIKDTQLVALPAYELSLLQVVERGEFSSGRHGKSSHFVNEFWLEADGHVAKSTQQWLPGEKALTLTQVKWVGRDYE